MWRWRQANLAVIATLTEQIELLEKRLQERVRPRSEYGLLTSVPGIGEILATVILLEIGSIERFADVGNFASYVRCVGSVHSSNGKKKGEGNTKNGNRYLAWAFVEAAHFALRYCPEAKRFYERKKAKSNSIVAIKALAHKLARACYHILKEHKPFDMTRCFTSVTTAPVSQDPGLDLKPIGLNWTPGAVPGCSEADRPRREPARDWRQRIGSHGSVSHTHWTRDGTNVFLGRLDRQGEA